MFARWLGFAEDSDDGDSSNGSENEGYGSHDLILSGIALQDGSSSITEMKTSIPETENVIPGNNDKLVEVLNLLQKSNDDCNDLREQLVMKDRRIKTLSEDLEQMSEMAELRQLLIDRLKSSSRERNEQMDHVNHSIGADFKHFTPSLSVAEFNLSECAEAKCVLENLLRDTQKQLTAREYELKEMNEKHKEELSQYFASSKLLRDRELTDSITRIASLQAEIQDLSNEISKQAIQIAALNSEKDTYLAEKSSLEEQLLSTSNLLHQRTQDYEDMKSVIADTERHLAQLAELLQDYEAMKRMMSSTEKELEETKALVFALMHSKAEGLPADVSSRNIPAESAHAILQQELKGVKDQLVSSQEACRSLTREKMKQEYDLRDLREKLAALTEDNNRLSSLMQFVKHENLVLQETLSHTSDRLSASSTHAVDEMKSAKLEAQKELLVTNQRLNDELELMQREASDAKLQVQELRRQLSAAAEKDEHKEASQQDTRNLKREVQQLEALCLKRDKELRSAAEALNTVKKSLDQESSDKAELQLKLNQALESTSSKDYVISELSSKLEAVNDEYSWKLKHAEASEAVAQEELAALRDNMRADSAALRAVTLEAEARCDELEKQVTMLQQELETRQDESVLADAELQELEKRLKDTKMNYSNLELKLLGVTQKYNDLKTQFSDVSSQNKQLSRELADCRRSLSESVTKIAFVEENAKLFIDSEVRCKSLEGQLETYKELLEMNANQDLLNNYDKQMKKMKQENERLRSDNDVLRVDLFDSQQLHKEDTKKLSKLLKELEKNFKTLEQEFTVTKEDLQSAMSQVDDAHSKIRQLEAAKSAVEDELSQLISSLSTVKCSSEGDRDAAYLRLVLEIKQLERRCVTLEECTKEAQLRLGQSECRCNQLVEQLMSQGGVDVTARPCPPDVPRPMRPLSKIGDAGLGGVCERCKAYIALLVKSRDEEIEDLLAHREESVVRLNNMKQQHRNDKRAFIEKIEKLEETVVEKEKIVQEYLHMQRHMTSMNSELFELRKKYDRVVPDDIGGSTTSGEHSPPSTHHEHPDAVVEKRADTEQRLRLTSMEAEVESLRAELRLRDQQILSVNRQNNELIDALAMKYDVEEEQSPAVMLATKKAARSVEKRNTELQAKVLTLDSLLKNARTELQCKDMLLEQSKTDRTSLLDELQELKAVPHTRSQSLIASLGLCNNATHATLEKRVEELSVKLQEAQATEERLEAKIKKLVTQFLG